MCRFTEPVIDLFHKSQNAPVPYPIMLHNVHIYVLNEALWDMEQVHSGICESGQLDWNFYNQETNLIC